MWIVEIEKGVWLAPWRGDPGRTLVKESAKQFDKEWKAHKALDDAREFCPFKHAKIEEVDECKNCAHLDEDWEWIGGSGRVSCSFGTPPQACKKFYPLKAVEAMYE